MKRKIIRIDEEKCDGCGQCVPACAEGALQIIDGVARLVDDSYCDGLGACLGECPQGAIIIEERETAAFDEDAVRLHLATLYNHEPEPKTLPCGCPGSSLRSIKCETPPSINTPHESLPSSLISWPVQMRLVPPNAPFLKNADLLISADCVPFALPDFHQRFLKGRIALVGCPKLDDLAYYRDKLEAIFSESRPRSVTVLRMEVPCCTGLAHAVADALQSTAPGTPLKINVISIEGDIQVETMSLPSQAG